ncbi:MAG: TerB family tellurite resistance protein [Cyanothece sp. SIO1E1]|nr:TerB family tellurite resistance protein [Cyanothece sp. SIO1E1]
MFNKPDVKSLFKILIGAAWIDGRIQPEERQYLHRIAQETGLANDPDIRPLLYEFITVKPADCYRWVSDYLGKCPDHEACQNLLEAISGLVYSDGEMAIEEAKLLSRIQRIEQGSHARRSIQADLLQTIRKLYQRWIVQQS